MIRRIARPMVAGVFIYGGINTLRNPGPRAEKAEPVVEPAKPLIAKTGIAGMDTEQLVRLDAAVKVAAGLLLVANRLPRLSSLALAASTAPTTVAGHRFWAEKDPAARRNETLHFLKNLSIFGGLLIATVDSGPRRPGREAAAKAAKAAASATKAVR